MSKDKKEGKVGYELRNVVVELKYVERVKLANLEYGTLIRLKTTEHSYEFALIDPRTGLCVMYGTDKDVLLNPVRCTISGSVINEGFSSLFSNFIVKEFYLELIIYNYYGKIYIGPIEGVDVEPNSPLAKKMIEDINNKAH